jgi:hypothetical protein
LSRQEPVLFARLEPGSRVIANGLGVDLDQLRVVWVMPMLRRLVVVVEQAEAARCCGPRQGLDAGDHVGARLRLEQVREALLQAQVLLDRALAADLRDPGDLAVAGLEDREDARLLRQPRDLDRVARVAVPQPSGQGTKTCR